MADTTPYGFPDASLADRLRFIEQQYAEALKAQSITDANGRNVTRQSLRDLRAEINELRLQMRTRGGVVHTSHGSR